MVSAAKALTTNPPTAAAAAELRGGRPSWIGWSAQEILELAEILPPHYFRAEALNTFKQVLLPLFPAGKMNPRGLFLAGQGSTQNK